MPGAKRFLGIRALTCHIPAGIKKLFFLEPGNEPGHNPEFLVKKSKVDEA